MSQPSRVASPGAAGPHPKPLFFLKWFHQQARGFYLLPQKDKTSPKRRKINIIMRETSRSGQKRILAAFDVIAPLVCARSNAGNRGVIPGDGGKRQPCVGKARRGGAGIGEPSRTAPWVSEKLLHVHSEKGVLTRDPGAPRASHSKRACPPFSEGSPARMMGGKAVEAGVAPSWPWAKPLTTPWSTWRNVGK